MPKFTGPAWRFIGHLANRAHLENWAAPDTWRAVLFHHVTDELRWRANDPLIHGLNVDISVKAFKERIRWLVDRYDVVSLDSVIEPDRIPRSRQRLLICFDDGYASVFELAAPILREFGIPWCFFLNARFVGNAVLPVDNIVAYIANLHGLEPLSDQAGAAVASAREFIGGYLSRVPPDQRRDLVEGLAAKLGINTDALARERRLFVDEAQIRALAESGVEIGNHTLDHVHCRTLSEAAAAIQIEDSARELERMSDRPVRAFAYPYGSMKDATAIARQAIQNSGHKCAFVVHNRSNSNSNDRYALFRIDLGEMGDDRAALELEILPRMREVLAGVRPRIGS